jgi:hypothetical protein
VNDTSESGCGIKQRCPPNVGLCSEGRPRRYILARLDGDPRPRLIGRPYAYHEPLAQKPYSSAGCKCLILLWGLAADGPPQNRMILGAQPAGQLRLALEIIGSVNPYYHRERASDAVRPALATHALPTRYQFVPRLDFPHLEHSG